MHNILSSFYKFKVVSGTPLGRACLATGNIVKNEIICKMSGPRITLKEFSEKYELDDCTPLQVEKDQFIDLLEPYVCFNHSCNPNAGLRNDGILFALHEIKEGEEIVYDYSTSVDDLWWKMDCKCNSKNCRKIITDFLTVPHEQKEFYYQNNALTGYIRRLYY